ncbi:MAG: FkbM family methyltransferase [Bacteroidetes bacterium]|nr:MAG: FkbM family methyltransferase [Bacteroidota bacterium]
MKALKSMLLQVLGQAAYLRLTSTIFFWFLRNGWLKNNPLYATHYIIRQFIKPGHTVIDIGANLGYYSLPFAKLVGPAGRVLAVEPIALYRSVLQKNIAHQPQVTVLPVALGQIEGKLKMGNPAAAKHRHGLMRVLSEDEANSGSTAYEVEVKNPVQLFDHLQRIDYLKCDIEGYEVPVIPEMQPLIKKHQPIVQIEVESQNKTVIFNLLQQLNYQLFYTQNGGLIPFSHPQQHLPADLIGIPAARMPFFNHLVVNAAN